MTIKCAECGKEYDPDDLIDMGQKIKYFCECGYQIGEGYVPWE